MRTRLALAALLVVFATASCKADDRKADDKKASDRKAGDGNAGDSKACIAKATEALPRIAGLTVKKTGTRPAPPSILATWQGQIRPIMVDVDTLLDGTAQTYSYICAPTKGAAFVRRVMG